VGVTGGREASAGQGARRRARRTRRYGGEVHGACGAMQAERRPYGAGAGEQGETSGVDSNSTVRV